MRRTTESPTDAGGNNVYDVTVRSPTARYGHPGDRGHRHRRQRTPVITSNGGGANAAVNVAENTTAVTTVTATDADLPARR